MFNTVSESQINEYLTESFCSKSVKFLPFSTYFVREMRLSEASEGMNIFDGDVGRDLFNKR